MFERSFPGVRASQSNRCEYRYSIFFHSQLTSLDAVLEVIIFYRYAADDHASTSFRKALQRVAGLYDALAERRITTR